MKNYCLNCGKEVKNKFCNTSCQNAYVAKQKRLKYEQNPKHCACCGEKLTWEQRKNKFCSHSCSAKINNLDIIRFKDSCINKISDDEFEKIVKSSHSLKEISNKIGYSYQTNNNKIIVKRCKNLNLSIPNYKDPVNSYTKEFIFKSRKNWQSARSDIRKNAEKIFKQSGNDLKCAICGYDKHIEIAHIKAVSEFSDTSLISEINNINNLIALCPNHHWEYDHGLLDLKL